LRLKTGELFQSVSLVPWITTRAAESLLDLALLGGPCPGWASCVCTEAVGLSEVLAGGRRAAGGTGTVAAAPHSSRTSHGSWRVCPRTVVTSWGTSTGHRPCAADAGHLCQAKGRTGESNPPDEERNVPHFFLQSWLYALLLLLLDWTAALIWSLLLHSGFKPLSPRGHLQREFLPPCTLEFCKPSAATFLLLGFSPFFLV